MYHVTLSIAVQLWRDFKSACVQRGLVASHVLADMMRAQLEKWESGK